MKNDSVTFRWKNDALVISSNENLEFPFLFKALKEKLSNSKNFFVNTQIKVIFENLDLTEIEQKLIIDLMRTTTQSQMQLSSEIKEKNDDIKKFNCSLFPQKKKENNHLKQINSATINVDFKEIGAKVHKGTVRSGQCINSDSHLIIIGDVNPSAEIRANGDIYVFGNLKGVVHAGQNGYEKANVIAIQMSPSQIRIANVIGRASNFDEISKTPEIAYLENDRIIIKQYQIY